MATESFGMMNEAYFVSRLKILNWINDLLSLQIERVEDCATGAIYCQIVDSIFGKEVVSMRKVDFTAKYEHEYIKNYKILQEAFRKIGLTKSVPVERLTKGKYQDNLEFLQWIYQWYQRNTGTSGSIEYDAVSRRSISKGGRTFAFNSDGSTPKKSPLKNPSNASKPKKNPPTRRPFRFAPNAAEKRLAEVEKQRVVLEKKIAELTEVAKDIEKERDFYFQKVLSIERLCLSAKPGGVPGEGREVELLPKLGQTILDLLYDKEGEKGVGKTKQSSTGPKCKKEENSPTAESTDINCSPLVKSGKESSEKFGGDLKGEGEDVEGENKLSWVQSVDDSVSKECDLDASRMEDDL